LFKERKTMVVDARFDITTVTVTILLRVVVVVEK
jgi:hypothetical protein